MNGWSLRLFCVAGLVLASSEPASGNERVEHTLTLERPLPRGGSLRVENLIGSLTLRADRTKGRAVVEARVVAEAETKEEAKALAEAIAIEPSTEGQILGVAIAFPVDRHASFRVPRSEKDGLMAKWVSPLLNRSTVSASYGGRTVEIGSSKGAAAIAVHLQVTVPLDINVEARQVVGTLQAVGMRGRLELEVVEGQVLAEQIYGSLQARSGGGDVTVRKFSGKAFEVQTASGALQLSEVTAEQARVTTSSGEIEGTGITAGSLDVQSGSGMVHLVDVDPVGFRVSSDSGEVDMGVRITRTREASVRTGSGDVTLRVNPTTPFELHAETAGGSVHHRDLAGKVLEEEKNLLRLQRGNGGVAVRVTSDKGDVVVRAI